MNKAEKVSRVANGASLSKAEAAAAVDGKFDVINDALAKGGSVARIGFGAFSVETPSARTGRNPRTGESIEIALLKAPTFKVGKTLRDTVN